MRHISDETKDCWHRITTPHTTKLPGREQTDTHSPFGHYLVEEECLYVF